MPPGAGVCTTPSEDLFCQLRAGLLTVQVGTAWTEAQELFGFAERDNPRRAFLFVSKVLGRHVPVAPSRMRAAFSALAAQLPADLPGPVLITGMAETAIGLGAGVHDAYLARTGRKDVLFMASTRSPCGHDPAAVFQEPHSHAPAQLMHWPREAGARKLFRAARSLVMVDDEATTGTTFRNLAAALAEQVAPGIERVVTAVLTDWSGDGGPDRMEIGGRTLPVARAALLHGRYSWQQDPTAPVRHLAPAVGALAARNPWPRNGDPRFGIVQRMGAIIPEELRRDPGVIGRSGERGGALHVIGAGEHVWESFLLAEALEAMGEEVLFSATTRSPILPGHAVSGGLVFRDHEGIGIDNFLYNVMPGARHLLCLDTGIDAVDPGLVAALGCDLVVDGFHVPYARYAARYPAPPCGQIGTAPSIDAVPATGPTPATALDARIA